MHPLIKHWETIATVLEGEIQQRSIGDMTISLSSAFWPKTNHGTGYKLVSQHEEANANDEEQVIENPDTVGLQTELNEEMQEREEMFVGRRSEMERERWVPLIDIQEEKFIMLNPNNEWEQQYGKGRFWLVKALSSVDVNHLSNDVEQAMFKIEWWRPKNVKDNQGDHVRYSKCFSATQSWERDPGYLETEEIWQLASSAIYGFKTRMKPQSISKSGLKIPKNVLETLQDSIKRLNV
jgi:hypothetical protein